MERAVAKHGLTFTDYRHRHDLNAPIGRFRSLAGALQVSARGTDNWKASSVPEFARAVVALSGDEWGNLQIYARMDKKAAIGMGKSIVGPILSVLDDLVPVYLETIA